MADINSNKNGIIIQPITLQIRAPFQFLTNQRAIKQTHYSESRDGLIGLIGRCFSVVCVRQGSTHSWTVSSSTKAVKLNRFHLFFTYISTSFSSSEEHRSVLCQPGMPSTVQISTQSTEYGSRQQAYG